MESLQRNMLSRMASEQIKAYILKHDLQVGDQLPTEREFAKALEVSRTVVREGLNELETLGMIQKIQGKGIFISEPNLSVFFQQIMSMWTAIDENVNLLIDLRMMLETAALEHVVRNANDVDYEMLERIVVESQNPSITGEEFALLDFSFHQKLLQLSRNPLFLQLMVVINEYFHLAQLKFQYQTITSSQMELTVREHREVLALLQNHQVEEAKQLMRDHLQSAKR